MADAATDGKNINPLPTRILIVSVEKTRRRIGERREIMQENGVGVSWFGVGRRISPQHGWHVGGERYHNPDGRQDMLTVPVAAFAERHVFECVDAASQ